LFPAVCEVSDEGAVDLDSIYRQNLKMPQRGVAGTEIVESYTAACVTQRVDKACRLLDVIQCRGFGDFYDEAAREIGPVSHQRNQRLKPRPVARGQTGYVETEPYLGMVNKLP
jgi:hypothetical protein